MEEEQRHNRNDAHSYAREYAGTKVIPLPVTSTLGVARLYAYGTHQELRRNAWTKKNKDCLTLLFFMEAAGTAAAYAFLPDTAHIPAYVLSADLGIRLLQGIVRTVHKHVKYKRKTIDSRLLDNFQENPGIAGIVRDLYKNVTS
ncbi:MAG: hypothetical protein ABIJ21_07000 [Nanoarchaeota archaeon]